MPPAVSLFNYRTKSKAVNTFADFFPYSDLSQIYSEERSGWPVGGAQRVFFLSGNELKKTGARRAAKTHFRSICIVSRIDPSTIYFGSCNFFT